MWWLLSVSFVWPGAGFGRRLLLPRGLFVLAVCVRAVGLPTIVGRIWVRRAVGVGVSWVGCQWGGNWLVEWLADIERL